jgi:hypothetical protein
MIEGPYSDVQCRKCGETGIVRIGRRLKNGQYKVKDFIQHKPDCANVGTSSQPRHLRKKGWRPQEKRANKLVGARATPASGALNQDGDGREFHGWRVEAKQTTKASYTLTQNVWQKLTYGALSNGEEPLLHVESRSGHSTERRVVILAPMYEALQGTPSSIKSMGRVSTTHRIGGYGAGPFKVELDPPGVEMDEGYFRRLKEEYDGNS